jgi:DNA repair protein RecN (Recombination protein N)
MIKNLYIKDFALVENSRVELSSGLNVIIGETGAGKSMLIDALIIAFGGRASSDLVRNNSAKAIIEVELIVNEQKLFDILNENDVDIESDSIIIRREISSKGNTRNFINDTPVNLNLIKQFGELFIDFHGQHDHQSLLNSANHSEIFDKSAGIFNLVEECNSKFLLLKIKISELNKLIDKSNSAGDKAEFQKFKLEEILKINPLENEDEILESELKLLENSEILHSLSSELFENLYLADDSIWNNLTKSVGILKQLSAIDSNFTEYSSELESSLISIKEVASFSNNYSESIEFNPDRIEEIRLRILQLKGLMKKYGSIQDILNTKNEIEKELLIYNNFDSEINKIKDEISEMKAELLKLSLEIEFKRLQYEPIFAERITSSLSSLGINNATFKTSITRKYSATAENNNLLAEIDEKLVELMPNGINQIEFFISTNLGESLKPLKQVASGGEVSRIMLSIKNILADKDNINCLVFDEIDTGVSGRIATMVGASMKNLAEFHQLIAISHLPQIAAVADSCILVEKFETNDNTFSHAKVLDNKTKIYEIAKMISGEIVTDASLRNADELINKS